MCDDSLSALSPETWPFSLDFLPVPSYMVGGAVRDALLGRRRKELDLDFVLPADAVKTAQKIASHYKAGFVLLDAERQIARVVFDQATADFAQAEGSSLDIDLYRRDFTMNAIAYNPHTAELIDPLKGYQDLQQGLIRMISVANLQDDPLRLLRGYRQAAQLDFVIEPETHSAIRQLTPLLSQVAAERVRTELGYLLDATHGTTWIITAVKDGLFQVWFPKTTPEQLSLLATIDHSAVRLGEIWPGLGNSLNSWVGDTLKTTWLGIAKLATLVPPTLEEAEVDLLRLKFSRAEIRGVTTALRYLPQLISAEMSVPEQFFFFREVGLVFPTLAVLAVSVQTPLEVLAPLINRYLTPNDQVAHPTPLVTGNDLMQTFNLSAGPQVGKLLTDLQLARAEGRISTPTEALEFASVLINESL